MGSRQDRLMASISGPVLLIVIGILLLIHQVAGIGLRKTWPVLLILFGVLELAKRITGEPR